MHIQQNAQKPNHSTILQLHNLWPRQRPWVLRSMRTSLPRWPPACSQGKYPLLLRLRRGILQNLRSLPVPEGHRKPGPDVQPILADAAAVHLRQDRTTDDQAEAIHVRNLPHEGRNMHLRDVRARLPLRPRR